MASRKDEKERVREQRQLREREAAARAQRRRRLSQVGALVVLAAVAVAALMLIGKGGKEKGGGAGAAGADKVIAMLRGIPQKGVVLGDPKAPVTVNEYADLQCPACKALANDSLPDFIESHVRTGKANIAFHNLIVIGPESRVAARAALAASKQGRLWQFVELFYRNQGAEGSGYVTDSFLKKIATGAGGLDLAAWETARKNPSLQAVIDRDQNAAVTYGFSSTPSLAIVGPGGTRKSSGVLPADQLAKVVEAVAKAS